MAVTQAEWRNPATGALVRAATWLGINCAMIPQDIAHWPWLLKYGSGWVYYPRQKKGHGERLLPLWDDTLAAIDDYLSVRPKPASMQDREYLFLSAEGRNMRTGYKNNGITRKFSDKLMRLGIKREGLSFYSLRHTFKRVTDELDSPQYQRFLMGHKEGSSQQWYENISDADRDKLRGMVDHVRQWLHETQDKTLRIVAAG